MKGKENIMKKVRFNLDFVSASIRSQLEGNRVLVNPSYEQSLTIERWLKENQEKLKLIGFDIWNTGISDRIIDLEYPYISHQEIENSMQIIANKILEIVG